MRMLSILGERLEDIRQAVGARVAMSKRRQITELELEVRALRQQLKCTVGQYALLAVKVELLELADVERRAFEAIVDGFEKPSW